MCQTDDIKLAVFELYRAFAHYKGVPDDDFCDHCIADEQQANLYSKPLEELAVDDLAMYAFKAMSTWGGVNQFKHFLPRLFELLAFDKDADRLWPEVLISKLDHAKWGQWPDNENAQVRSYLKALWQYALTEYPYPVEISELLWGIARAGVDVREYLELWRNLDTITAVRHLAEFVELAHMTKKNNGHLSQGMLSADAQGTIERWLLSPETREKLESAFFANSEREEAASELSQAVQYLSWWTSTPGIESSNQTLQPDADKPRR